MTLFTQLHQDPHSMARSGILQLRHGIVRTPVFMPVATRGAIRALTLRDIDEIGFEMILSNTYHLHVRPGMDTLTQLGGLHRFMNYSRPILTDSGGFQVFSLSDRCKVRDDGVEFKSHFDGRRLFFTPENVLESQRVIGSDIMMVLDQCTDYPVSEKDAEAAVERTVFWAGKSINHFQKTFSRDDQTLFAIVQGSVYKRLRRECAQRLVELDFPGYAIGGLSVGEPKELYREMTHITLPLLPVSKPRYMMGVGSPLEMLEAISCGVDMFDCVMPTRIARNGTLYTTQGRITIKAQRYEKDESPLDPACSCYVCRNYSRAYLRHIFRMGEIAALIYNTHHNLHFMKSFMDEIRTSIEERCFNDTKRKWETVYTADGDNS